jgi:hypothetical protein
MCLCNEARACEREPSLDHFDRRLLLPCQYIEHAQSSLWRQRGRNGRHSTLFPSIPQREILCFLRYSFISTYHSSRISQQHLHLARRCLSLAFADPRFQDYFGELRVYSSNCIYFLNPNFQWRLYQHQIIAYSRHQHRPWRLRRNPAGYVHCSLHRARTMLRSHHLNFHKGGVQSASRETPRLMVPGKRCFHQIRDVGAQPGVAYQSDYQIGLKVWLRNSMVRQARRRLCTEQARDNLQRCQCSTLK